MSGFAETFSQYIMEVSPGGGSDRPEPEPGVEGVLFVVEGERHADRRRREPRLKPGGYAYLPPGSDWTLRNEAEAPVASTGSASPTSRSRASTCPSRSSPTSRTSSRSPMPGHRRPWATTRFVDPADLRHDMHVNIVTFEPGGVIPFAETHVMEHGLYVLEGKAVYRLNSDWVEVEAGDFMWLRAFCPQACYAGGPGRFRYLLYKDVNRHPD